MDETLFQEQEPLAPFIDGDIAEEVCENCEYKAQCLILKYVNKLSVKRDGAGVSEKFACNLFKEEDVAV